MPEMQPCLPCTLWHAVPALHAARAVPALQQFAGRRKRCVQGGRYAVQVVLSARLLLLLHHAAIASLQRTQLFNFAIAIF
jgi:hypothetical protein